MVFSISSWKILIIVGKTVTITVISNEARNELTVYAILFQNVTMFYRQELSSLFQMQGKLKACKNSK